MTVANFRKNYFNNKGFLLLFITTIIVLFTIFTVKKDADLSFDSSQAEEKLFFKDLKSKINDIEAISIVKRGDEIQFKNINGVWVSPDQYDFPVDVAKIKELVMQVSDLKILEKKTSDPNRYKYLGLDDPYDAESNSARIILHAGKGKGIIGDFLVGDLRKFSGKSADQDALYVKKSNDVQTYLVSGVLDFKANAVDWLDTSFIKVDSKDIKFVKLSKGENSFSIRRENKDQKDFTLDNLDLNIEKIKDQYDLNQLATSLEFIEVKSITPIENINFGSNSYNAKYEKFDGTNISLNAIEQDGRYYISLTYNRAGSSDVTDNSDIEEYNKKSAPWAFEISKYEFNIISKDKSDLLENKEDKKIETTQ